MPPSARILLVDDHEIARQGVASLIAAQPGWQVCGEAADGREGLRLAVELKPDVVVLDMLMPGLNGLDAARLLKKQVPAAQLLILSGHEESTLIRPAFDAGVRAYILKSQARTHLIPAISALLAGILYLTPEVSQVLRADAIDNPPPNTLTPREREIIQLLSEGMANRDIAGELGISTKTAETHRASIMRKLRVESLADLVLYAIRNKIIQA
jgi:DNA-binding NarL/FixJ family response regulator